jgi:hypothetical protein
MVWFFFFKLIFAKKDKSYLIENWKILNKLKNIRLSANLKLLFTEIFI